MKKGFLTEFFLRLHISAKHCDKISENQREIAIEFDLIFHAEARRWNAEFRR
jgi:hypothetical protein